MKKETEELLATSLTAKTTEVIPFLPYLLCDFWELGSDPSVIIHLIEKHTKLGEGAKVLDLACGKGAVSVKLAEKLKVSIKGIDILPEFIEYAIDRAKEYKVHNLCNFVVGDINDAVKEERDYDCVILGAVGGVLGDQTETIHKLKGTIKEGGYIIIDESYLPKKEVQESIQYNKHVYITRKEWDNIFENVRLEVIETAFEKGSENLDSNEGMEAITKRANELIKKHPDKKAMFEGYVQSQQNEYSDIDNNLISVTWILKSK